MQCTVIYFNSVGTKYLKFVDCAAHKKHEIEYPANKNDFTETI